MEYQIIKNPIFLNKYFDSDISDYLFNKLIKLNFGNGIKTRFGGFTRKAIAINETDEIFYEITDFIYPLLTNYKVGNLIGYYINYYENGECYTPQHIHKDTNQLVVSLGDTRTLNVEGKNYKMSHGDVIIFGNQKHGVPKEKNNKERGRISIATFCL